MKPCWGHDKVELTGSFETSILCLDSNTRNIAGILTMGKSGKGAASQNVAREEKNTLPRMTRVVSGKKQTSEHSLASNDINQTNKLRPEEPSLSISLCGSPTSTATPPGAISMADQAAAVRIKEQDKLVAHQELEARSVPAEGTSDSSTKQVIGANEKTNRHKTSSLHQPTEPNISSNPSGVVEPSNTGAVGAVAIPGPSFVSTTGAPSTPHRRNNDTTTEHIAEGEEEEDPADTFCQEQEEQQTQQQQVDESNTNNSRSIQEQDSPPLQSSNTNRKDEDHDEED